MTNLEYYSFKNLDMRALIVDSEYVAVVVDYIPKHNPEPIRLYSQLVENDGEKIKEAKIKWLLKECEISDLSSMINPSEPFYIPKHEKKVVKQYCFEG